jgi:hypothetical protein
MNQEVTPFLKPLLWLIAFDLFWQKPYFSNPIKKRIKTASKY